MFQKSACQRLNRQAIFLISEPQRSPIEALQLGLSARAMERISSTDVFQIWAKF